MEDHRFFLIMFGFGVLMGLVTLIYVIKQAFSRETGEVGGWEIRGAPRRIRAVARTTLAEGIRAKAAAGFAGLIVVAVPVFWLTATGDGTIKGQVQMFLSYTLGFAAFLLGVLTILFSCRSLSVEIASRQIYGLASKPVPRWQIVAGKWLGVMTLNVLLLVFVTLLGYAGTQVTLRQFRARLAGELQSYGGLPPDQAHAMVGSLDRVRGIGRKGLDSPVVTAFSEVLGKTPQEIGDILLKLPEETRMNLRRYDEMRRQVIVARAACSPAIPDFQEEVEAQYKRMKESGELPEGWTERKLRRQLQAILQARYCTIAPGAQNARQWIIAGPPPARGQDTIMSLRFKLTAPGYVQAQEINGQMLEADTLLCVWGIGDPAKATFVSTMDAYPTNVFYELEIPADSIEADGTVIVNFANLDPRRSDVTLDLSNRGLEVLYRVGPFELGLLQSALAILIPLACLAAFGVCASTFLSFPVGVLIVLTLYVVASSMGFVADALAATKEYVGPYTTLQYEVRKATVETLDWLLAIGDLNPVSKLIEGRAVGWGPLWNHCWRFVMLKGAAVFVLAVFVLRRRELAAVIV